MQLSEAQRSMNSVLMDALVPGSGPAPTVEGEMLRAINRILYRYYNDGDLWWCGPGCCREHCGSAAGYLLSDDCPMGTEPFASSAYAGGDYYERVLVEVLERVHEYIRARMGVYQSNDKDMLRYDPIYDEEDNEEFLDGYEDDWS